MTQRSMMGLVRRGKPKIRGTAYLVTWDIDSRDRTAVNRMQYFLFGRGTRKVQGTGRHAQSFVWKEGVRYVAQSALLVTPDRLKEILDFLQANGIDHETEAVLIP